MHFVWREKFTVLLLALLVGGATWAWTTVRVYPARAGTSDVFAEAAVVQQLKKDVLYLSETLGSRNQSTDPEAVKQAADWLAERLTQLGYAPERERVNSASGFSDNVYIEIPGKSPAMMILGTHYDTHPHSPGADDNASGVAVLLSLLERAPLAKMALPHTVRVYFFTNEEWPFFHTNAMGSRVAARNLALAGQRVAAAWIIDAVGYFSSAEATQEYPWFLDPFFDNRGDFLLVVSDIDRIAEVEWLRSTLRERTGRLKIGGYLNRRDAEDMDQSDHASFWEFGFPALLITDTALFRNPYYHQHSDVSGTLDYERLALFATAFEHAFRRRLTEGLPIAASSRALAPTSYQR